MNKIYSLINKITKYSSWYQSIALLAVRFYMAKVFLMSGLTKIGNWDSTVMLFEYEYDVPFLSPNVAAYMATTGEFLFPALLILGFFTPVAALGMMAMTLVIELFVYPGTADHYYWLLLCGTLLTHGSGRFGVDYFLDKKFLKPLVEK